MKQTSALHVVFCVVLTMCVFLVLETTAHATLLPAWIPHHLRPPFWRIPHIHHHIAVGKRKCTTLSISACCILRDEVDAVHRTIPEMLTFLKTHFKSVRLYLVENDSTDGTTQALQKFAQSNPSHVRLTQMQNVSASHSRHMCTNGTPNCGLRGKMLASLRQQCLDACLDDPDASHTPDVVLIFDVDYRTVWYPGILDSFGSWEEWDVVCANSVGTDGFMYDWGSFNGYDQTPAPFRMSSGHSRFVPFEHCFGSMSLYRASMLNRRVSRYDIMEKEYPIEHIAFVRALPTNRVYANTNMVISV
jgi:glycosyltransferase involved in cell wall biosynthesis